MKKENMNRLKRIIGLAMIIAMVFALAACGNKTGGSDSSGGSGTSGGPIGSGADSLPANATAEDVIKQVQENMAAVKSMTYAMDMEIGMTVFGSPIDTITKADVEVISSPVALKLEGTMDMGDFEGGEDMDSMNLSIYAEEENGKLVTYSGIAMEGDIHWTKDTVDMDSAQVSQYNAKASLDLYLKNISNFKEAGTETVGGVSCVRYDGTISGDDLNEVVAASGAGVQLESFGEIDGEIFKDAGDMSVSLWVDEKDLLVRKYSIDMSDVMAVVMDKIMGAAMAEAGAEGAAELGDMGSLFSFTKMVVDCEVTGMNNVSEIVIPDEVKEKAETL